MFYVMNFSMSDSYILLFIEGVGINILNKDGLVLSSILPAPKHHPYPLPSASKLSLCLPFKLTSWPALI